MGLASRVREGRNSLRGAQEFVCGMQKVRPPRSVQFQSINHLFLESKSVTSFSRIWEFLLTHGPYEKGYIASVN
jgi:hypothetical protein